MRHMSDLLVNGYLGKIHTLEENISLFLRKIYEYKLSLQDLNPTEADRDPSFG